MLAPGVRQEPKRPLASGQRQPRVLVQPFVISRSCSSSHSWRTGGGLGALAGGGWETPLAGRLSHAGRARIQAFEAARPALVGFHIGGLAGGAGADGGSGGCTGNHHGGGRGGGGGARLWSNSWASEIDPVRARASDISGGRSTTYINDVASSSVFLFQGAVHTKT